MKRLLIFLIKFYQHQVSPILPPTCKFQPSCSQYALEAIELHGVVRGTFLALLRILRCNPFAVGGFDPVPPKRCEKLTTLNENQEDKSLMECN